MPVLFLRDPEIIKQLAITDFNHFVDHRTFMDDRSDVLFGNSLLQLRGDKWREMRAALSPSFTGTKMRQMFELVNDCAFDMTEYFKNQSATGKEIHIEMKELFSKYTTDVIASTAFGIKVNSFENSKNEFFVTGSRMLNLDGFKSIAKLILLRTAPWIMKALNIQFLDGCAARFFKKLVLDTIDVRMRNNIFRPDMINILMQLKIGNKAEQQQLDDNDGSDTMNDSKIGSASEERQWTDNEIVAQCFLFFLAGFDTTSTSLSFTAYELGRHPEIQDKLYAEIIETNARLNGKKVTYDDLQKMKYMDQVITESLRFWPPTPVTDRICVKDYDYDDGTLKFRIDKGTMLMIPIYPIHHDAEYYPEPEKFDPERFSDENNHNIRSCTFMPFGVGPRMCLGKIILSLNVINSCDLHIYDFRISIRSNVNKSYNLLPAAKFHVCTKCKIANSCEAVQISDFYENATWHSLAVCAEISCHSVTLKVLSPLEIYIKIF